MAHRKASSKTVLRGFRRWAKKSAQNAVELARLGRLTAVEGEPFEVVDHTRVYKLRRYGLGQAGQPRGPAILLVPPLMLTAEIYDVDPELSAVGMLARAGIDPWVIDFGAPEREAGGMERTLDDHVRAVAEAVERVATVVGRDVHLAGYSQGGMFAYQGAAYRRSDRIGSVITFGSPVDLHRFVPFMGRDIVGRIMRATQPLVEVPLGRIEGLPGILTSTGFKLLTPRKEMEQLVDFVRKLHDRQALRKRERRRRFMGGEGFVAWPGPALRQFFDEFIVHNRMLSGGIVIDGRTLTLADITCPILRFVGDRDDFAPARAVRAIERAAPNAEHHEVVLPAGHFGLVVGSTSLREGWPSVIAWLRWRDGLSGEPAAFAGPPSRRWAEEPDDEEEADFDFRQLTDEVLGAVRNRLLRVGEAFQDASDTAHDLRWQLPRLARLGRMTGTTPVSASRALANQAQAIGGETFFLWRGRAFSYADADTRVNHVTRGLIHCDVHPGDRVGVLMEPRPSYLSVVTALNRLGAVPVLVSPNLVGEPLAAALKAEPLAALATDPDNAARCRDAFSGGKVLVLGGGAKRQLRVDGVQDMEAIDPEGVTLPSWYRPNPGRARDLAMILVGPQRDGQLKVSRISNGRWAFSALGVASAATLSPADTVYCCLPLHHPTGIMVSVGGALIGGARLALSPGFRPAELWNEVRRYGATVVFYAGEMARQLLAAPPSPSDHQNPVRLFAGSGMRRDAWQRLAERFRVEVLEFYASTERNLVLANASGEKKGAVGRPIPGSAELALVRYDLEQNRFVERHGRLQRVPVGEPGVAIARIPERVRGAAVRQDVFMPGDRWYVTADLLRRDEDGDFWFIDRLDTLARTAHGAVATPLVEDGLYQLTEIELCAAYGVRDDENSHDILVAAVVSRVALDVARVSTIMRRELEPDERPRIIRRVTEIPLNEGFRPIKSALRAAGLEPGSALETLRYDEERQRYALI
ncbi:MAG: AMP-binding protein [Deltaproteobacteria bacterium]|nr:AMP-binding protein [Deltaproteobacteria bacterium]